MNYFSDSGDVPFRAIVPINQYRHIGNPQPSHCKERKNKNYCCCFSARLSQDCQSCKNRIIPGDCIGKKAAGWCHTECPNEENRGLPSIRNSYNSVDHLLLLENDPSPQLQAYASNARAPVSMATVVTPEKPTKRPRLAADNSEFATETSTTSCRRALNFSSAKSDTDGARASGVRETKEQQDILSYKAELGEIVAINALAGCGKTTTIALLCNKLQERHMKLLYLVFGRKNSEEAKQSTKFPKDNMDIRTTHAYIHRYYFGTDRKFKPENRYELKEIIDTCDLQSELIQMFPGLSEQKSRRRVSTVASYIRRTIEIFQSSADKSVEEDHVFWRAKKKSGSSRSAWKKKIKVQRYVRWAQEFFDCVEKACQDLRDYNTDPSISVTHDSYLKVAQLEEFHIDADVILIDEAQDMTPCQANLFWGKKQRKDKRVYLFGDRYQQLFRFRGASDSFWKAVNESRPKLKLTGSFRFGENIATCASAILHISAKEETILGLSTKKGTVSKHIESLPKKGLVILCRTNQGIYNYLMDHRPSRWCTVDGKQFPLKQKPWISGLEAFLNKEADTFVYKGEEFGYEAAIRDFAEDEGDSEVMRYLSLLSELKKREKPLDSFLQYIRKSFTKPKENQALDDYDGVVLGTVHKAKGLEFKRVVIYDDFKFDIINSKGEVQDDIFCDEANILYVATTRAKEKLYLYPEAFECFSALLGPEVDTEKLSVPVVHEDNLIALFAEWKEFEASSDTIDSISDIPWLPQMITLEDHQAFGLDSTMEESTYRNCLRQLMHVYHPDKFFPRHGSRISSSEVYSGTKIRLEKIIRRLTQLYQGERGWSDD
mmetsp:Transcript_36437/g.88223  ORF Transcript_36437/g.88223 Transcript_36437/m.88223 type:complete len:829 (+) Transcript_36437:62-2548(+)